MQYSKQNNALSAPPSKTSPSLIAFLEECKEHPMKSHVIGNEAGDADSIISATTLVYIESTRQKHEQDSSCFNSSSGFGYTRIQRKASLKLGWNFESESNASLYRQSRHCKFSSGCSSYLGRPQCCLLSKPSGQIDLCLCNLLP